VVRADMAAAQEDRCRQTQPTHTMN
jgi:hypothetical protein